MNPVRGHVDISFSCGDQGTATLATGEVWGIVMLLRRVANLGFSLNSGSVEYARSFLVGVESLRNGTNLALVIPSIYRGSEL